MAPWGRRSGGCAWTERLGAFVDGELAPPAEDELAAHLEGCEACAVELAQIEQLEALGSAAFAAPPVPAEEWDRRGQALRAAIEAEGGVKKERGGNVIQLHVGSWLGGLAAAAAVLIAAAAWIAFSAGGLQSPPVLAFDTSEGANAADVVDLAYDEDDGYTAGVMYPSDDSEPVVIVLTRL
jgi:anti-sigma factor RsiW